MPPRQTRERLQRDRKALCLALRDYEAGAMSHLEEAERETLARSIAQRIADLDARIDAFDGAAT